MRIGILEPDSFSASALQRLNALGVVEDYRGGERAAFLGDKDVLFVRLAHHIDAAFLAQAPRLAFLCSPTTGHTHIDVDALTRRGIALLSLQGASEFMEEIRATPEHVLGLTIALLRNYRWALLAADNAHWDRDRCRGEEIAGTRFGLVGLGRVGRRVASYLHTLGAEIACYDPYVAGVPPHIRRYDRLTDLIGASRVVILLASYIQGVPPIIDADAIAALGGKYFINVARGELVDESALLAAIEGMRLAGAAIDVISNDPGGDRARWIAATQARNLILTPHIGGATFRSMRLTEEFIAEQLIDAVVAARRRRGVS